MSLSLVSCDSKPSHETELAWQDTFRTALVDGYHNFKGHYVNSDTTVYIFSYQLPTKLSAENAVAIIQKQIRDHKLISKSPTELVLQRSIPNFTPEGFSEYRFLIDKQQGKITVMFASLDTPVKLQFRQAYIDELNAAHREYVSRVSQ